MKALVLKGFATRNMSCHAGQTIDVDGALLEDLKGAKYIKPISSEAEEKPDKKAAETVKETKAEEKPDKKAAETVKETKAEEKPAKKAPKKKATKA